jgi:hypothetical protein
MNTDHPMEDFGSISLQEIPTGTGIYSTDPVMDAALQDDAAKLIAMGQDPGPTLSDLEIPTETVADASGQAMPPVGEAGDLIRHRDGRVAWLRFIHGDGWSGDYLNGTSFGNSSPKSFAFIGRPDAEGWIPWSGGENPVPGLMVDYVDDWKRSWMNRPSDAASWNVPSGPCCIIAFRLSGAASPSTAGTEPSSASKPSSSLPTEKDKGFTTPETGFVPTEQADETAGQWDTARYLLWMMHARGPDDIYPAPNYETAVEWSDRANAIGPEVKAVPALWTGTRESHVENLAAATAGWELPNEEVSK